MYEHLYLRNHNARPTPTRRQKATSASHQVIVHLSELTLLFVDVTTKFFGRKDSGFSKFA
jgi:hypothetical protein